VLGMEAVECRADAGPPRFEEWPLRVAQQLMVIGDEPIDDLLAEADKSAGDLERTFNAPRGSTGRRRGRCFRERRGNMSRGAP
jgi:hypothetical protein